MTNKNFIVGIAVGMVAGGAVVCVLKMPKKKKYCGIVGSMLKATGRIVENISDTFGI